MIYYIHFDKFEPYIYNDLKGLISSCDREDMDGYFYVINQGTVETRYCSGCYYSCSSDWGQI